MGDAGKILTVSYGAFSCRLEGFEEPVALVRAIAGVFDDLGTSSPWFGFPAADPEALAAMAGQWRLSRDTAALQGAAGPPRNDAAGARRDENTSVAARPDTDAPARDGDQPPPPGRPGIRAAAVPAPDAAVERLMRRTNDTLAGEDSRLRHRLVGHLKAAVAATRAGEAVGAGPHGASDEMVARFRADLASEVAARPDPDLTARPPVAGTRASAGPKQDGAAPGRPEDARTGLPGISPTPPPTGGFAAFAAQRGARELHDVLEAAAVYATEVEGLEAFTRQHVMRRATALDPGGTQMREAGLRAFGRLLREGRLVRARRGLFALAQGGGAPA